MESEFWKGSASPIAVQIEPVTGHRLVIGSLGNEGIVLDDGTENRRLGLLIHLDYFGVEINWDHGDGHLRFTTIGPLTAEQLRAGSGWTLYAPLQ